MKNWYKPTPTAVYLWAILGIVFIPHDFYLIGFQESITTTLFGPFIQFCLKTIAAPAVDPPAFTSDAPGLWGLVVVLLLPAIAGAIVLNRVPPIRPYRENIVRVIRVMICYYLALQLLKYGFDKVFKAQFYRPEPNILYTPVGQLDKDILFWTAMGTSWSYNVFMGLMEVIPATFLLFRRTRVLGLLIITGVLMNVVMINYSFGITVKLFSTFLLALAVLALLPFFRALYTFFVSQKPASLPAGFWDIPGFYSPFIKTATKTFVVGMIFAEALYPYISSGNFNDDLALRPPMHGAYRVVSMTGDSGDTLASPLPVKRFFIHRHHYLIFQNQQDRMQDFKLTSTSNSTFQLVDYQLKSTLLQYHYDPVDSSLTMEYPYLGRMYRIKGARLPDTNEAGH